MIFYNLHIDENWLHGQENWFCPKGTPLKWPTITDNFWDILTLKGGGRQTVETRSIFGVPLKSLGYNCLDELCGRSVASKLSQHESDGVFYRADKETDQRVHFLESDPFQKFSTQIFWGVVPVESLRTPNSEHLCPHHSRPKSNDVGKKRPLCKNTKLNKK